MKIKEHAKTWTVRYTRPKTVSFANGGPRVFEYNYCSIIVSANVMRAVEKLMTEFSDATIISVNPGSTGPVLIDLDAIE